MSRIRQKGTEIEVLVQGILKDLNIRHIANDRRLPGTPDLFLPDYDLAIFVHGCFWHGHVGCGLATKPKRNRESWLRKIEQNRLRDSRKVQELRWQGYDILTLWQCELEEEATISKIRDKIAPSNRRSSSTKIRYTLDRSRKKVSRSVTIGTSRYSDTFKLDGAFPHRCAEDIWDWHWLREAKKPTWKHRGENLRVVDVFCGLGGLTLGLFEAARALRMNFESVLAIDSDPVALEVYKRNFDPAQFFNGDILDFVPKDLSRIVNPDFLLAGPPCQGHSDLNNHTRRADKRNTLYFSTINIAEALSPRYVIIENVPAVQHSKTDELNRSVRKLKSFGYSVDHQVFDLRRFGVPQSRRRHVLVASLDSPVELGSLNMPPGLDMKRTVDWAISDCKVGQGLMHSHSRLTIANIKRANYLLENNLYDLPNRMRPKCHQDDGHSYKSMYGRLRGDRVAQTITTGFGSPGQGRFLHPTSPRTLTPREASRLQMIPDWLDFSSVEKRTGLARLIGNSVPSPLTYYLALHLLRKRI